jgi:hypothetical protein
MGTVRRTPREGSRRGGARSHRRKRLHTSELRCPVASTKAATTYDPTNSCIFNVLRCVQAARSLLIGPAAEVTQDTFLPYFTGMKHMLEKCEVDTTGGKARRSYWRDVRFLSAIALHISATTCPSAAPAARKRCCTRRLLDVFVCVETPRARVGTRNDARVRCVYVWTTGED